MKLRSLGMMLILTLAPVLAATAAAPAKAPFELTADEQAALDAVLKTWEAKREHGFVFHRQFKQYQYDSTFGPQTTNDLNELQSLREGEIDYKSPQEWRLQETARREYTCDKLGISPSKLSREELLGLYKPDQKGLSTFSRVGELFEMSSGDDKKLRFTTGDANQAARQLNQVLDGWLANRFLSLFADGPLPVAFSEHPTQLGDRYWLRIITPVAEQGKNIWLEAAPKPDQNAAFDRVELILSAADYEPAAVQVVLLGGAARKSFVFLPHTDDAPAR